MHKNDRIILKIVLELFWWVFKKISHELLKEPNLKKGQKREDVGE